MGQGGWQHPPIFITFGDSMPIIYTNLTKNDSIQSVIHHSNPLCGGQNDFLDETWQHPVTSCPKPWPDEGACPCHPCSGQSADDELA